MNTSVSGNPVVDRVRRLVAPITDDLGLDLYDIEQRGGTLRVTVDTQPGSESGVTLDAIALVTRLVSRELDHDDPVPGRYTLEVTSPGVERSLRTPAHFQREVGKLINVRLADESAADRRLEGLLVSAGESTLVVRPDGGDDRTINYDQIDRARTVFAWGPSPKPGSPKSQKRKEMKPS
ncbi:MAG: ribosome maturation factor RimP [Acidimicrobiia bacterium]|jgi:ribosome maturation factor RimP|nr:ribosome maturation factor RimP [Acidimicrobiia bacterium]MBA3982466.1 ribosome maturation factor RimP [Acidimicrobiia bacterium]MDQ3351447.1 ribosome maturation factor RimP [Actinomycetota bacterium]MDQ3389934.1 ribosome maturation factor RimP [Actinomycetota bacterium]